MTRLKDIPALARDGKNLNAVIEAVRETLQTFRGYRGDDLDRALTPRDFAPGVLGGLTSGGGGGGTIFVIASGGGGGGADPTPDPTPPPTATGLVVTAGISHIFVSCDVQSYTQGHGHGTTVVYGAKWPSGTAPTFSSAVELFAFQGTFSAYSSDPATRWCIWIKWKSNDGYLSVSPAGGTNGVQATTGQDVSTMRTALNGQIRESELYITLGTRIDLIDAADTVAGSVAARVKAERDARITAVGDAISTAATYTETYAYENSLGEQVALDLLYLTSVVTDPSTGLAATRATLTSDYATIAGATNSLASVTTSLQAYANAAADTAQSDAESNAQVYAENYTTNNAYAKTTGEALASSVSALSAAVQKASLGLPFTSWTLNGQSIVTITDGKVGDTALRLVGPVGGYPNQGNFIPIDRTKKYRVRFWARPSSDATGILYFSLRQADVDRVFLAYPYNGGREVYKPSHTRDAHNAQFGTTDQWGEYSYVWDSADWAAPTFFVQPDFLDNYSDAAGHWDVQDFSFEEVTDFENLSASVTDINEVVVGLGDESIALASRSSTLEARVNTPSTDPGSTAYSPAYAAVQSEISARASLTDGLSAQWTVKLDMNGYVSGFGLASTAGDATPTSSFIVRTDKFAIASPFGPGIDPAEPFIVQTTPTTINGVYIPAGVYMDSAFIYDLTASIARLGTSWIDNAMIGNLSASKLTIGDGSVGGNLKSTSYSGGSGGTPGAGWLLQPGGNAYFNNAILYGTIYASAGVFSGSLSGASITGATGNFTGTLNGANITGVTGTFSGSLNVKSATSGTRMEITTSYIRGYNGSTLRFEASV